MAVLRAPNGDELPADPREWRPQVPRATRRAPEIRDPIIEPLWSGTRVIAHFEAGVSATLVLIDEKGQDVSDRDPQVLAELSGAILATDAVIDGILSSQATRGGEGASIIHRPQVSRGGIFLPRDAGIEVERPGEAPRDAVIAFVALDLLQVDGQSLFEVPLLERKRLLESLVAQSERVRVSVHTRPPVDPWIASWKGAGFRGVMLKAANGRYSPGGYADDWTTITRIHQRR